MAIIINRKLTERMVKLNTLAAGDFFRVPSDPGATHVLVSYSPGGQHVQTLRYTDTGCAVVVLISETNGMKQKVSIGVEDA